MCGILLLLSSSDTEGMLDLFPPKSWKEAFNEVLRRRGPDHCGDITLPFGNLGNLYLMATVLHMRGSKTFPQPAVDEDGNILLWNGEIFGGSLGSKGGVIPSPSEIDTEAVLLALKDLSPPAGSDLSDHIRDVMSGVEGPWSMVYYHKATRSLHYGRDRLGRRSLVWTQDEGGTILAVSSTSVAIPREQARQMVRWRPWEEVGVQGLWSLHLDGGGPERQPPRLSPWLSAPVWPLPSTTPSQTTTRTTAAVALQSNTLEEASGSLLEALQLAVRRRVCCAPPPLPSLKNEEEENCISPPSKVAILYSGGLDCQVLAALAYQALAEERSSPKVVLDLINVCFHPQHRSPDRLGAIKGFQELSQKFPEGEWRLVLVDVSYDEVREVEERIKQLIKPCFTPMDFNIATSFYFASRGRGKLVTAQSIMDYSSQELDDSEGDLLRYGVNTKEQQEKEAKRDRAPLPPPPPEKTPCRTPGCRRLMKPGCAEGHCGHCCTKRQTAVVTAAREQEARHPGSVRGEEVMKALCRVHKMSRKYLPRCLWRNEAAVKLSSSPQKAAPSLASDYRSRARIVLLGIGADEQLAGYGRHRTTFRRGGTEALEAELDMDLNRLWKRNLGRDDRCISYHSREARFPYLDEQVMETLKNLCMECKFNLEEPRGIGDKKILRHLAREHLDLPSCSSLVKRAIQFGSRIAQASSTENFGSHRAGKQNRYKRTGMWTEEDEVDEN